MKITLTGEASLLLEAAPGMLTIEAPSRDRSYSPFHMLGSGLAMCTFSVLQSWASNKNLHVDDLKIDVKWKFAEGEHRVERMDARIEWPSLPAELWPRALRNPPQTEADEIALRREAKQEERVPPEQVDVRFEP